MSDPTPAHFREAITRADVLRTTQTGERTLSKSRYYERPIRQFLKALGCPANDLDDLTQEALLRLYTRILAKYDPARGPFRPYLKQALRHLLADHFRQQNRPMPANAAPENSTSAEPATIDDALLAERLGAIFERYMREVVSPENLQAAEVLARRLAGDSQRTIAETLGVTERWVRTLQERAAERFFAWAREQFHPDDWCRLVPAELANWRPRGLIRWLSRAKRRQLAAVLVALFARQTDADFTGN